jgi:hypothetical protein
MTTVKNNGDACQCVLNTISNNLSYNLNNYHGTQVDIQ